MESEPKILITPNGLKYALRQAFRTQNEERFEEPLINYLGWQIFGPGFPKERFDEWNNVYDWSEVHHEKAMPELRKESEELASESEAVSAVRRDAAEATPNVDDAGTDSDGEDNDR